MLKEQSIPPAVAATRRPTPEAINRLVATLQKGQRFSYQHSTGERDFAEGFRRYALYRDLGLSDATGGLVQAHVVRLVGKSPDEARQKHYHDTCFQMVYVLKGWETIQMEGYEPVRMQEGSVWIQPPQITHAVVDFSDGCEVLEIILPAEFETVNT